jgi:uncharacterized protein with LGFP repeats
MVLATAFPRSTFVGYDLDCHALERARADAARRGLRNVSFEQCDAAQLTAAEPFDVVFVFNPTAGMHEVHGRVGVVYWSQGGPAGTWGYPITDEYPDGPTGRSSDFEGGTLAWAPATDVLEVFAPAPGAVTPAAGEWATVPARQAFGYHSAEAPDRHGHRSR